MGANFGNGRASDRRAVPYAMAMALGSFCRSAPGSWVQSDDTFPASGATVRIERVSMKKAGRQHLNGHGQLE